MVKCFDGTFQSFENPVILKNIIKKVRSELDITFVLYVTIFPDKTKALIR